MPRWLTWLWTHRQKPRVVIPVPAEIGDSTPVWITLKGTIRTRDGSTYVTAGRVTAHAMTGGCWSEEFTDWAMPVLEVRGLIVRGEVPDAVRGT